MDKVAVINQKGGVGKTTTTVNLGAALAERGQRVLLIDLDPQANLGTHLGVDVNEIQPTVYDVLVHRAPIERAIFETDAPGLSVVPSNLDLSAAEMELVSMMGRETLLRDALDKLERERPDAFDTVLMDCPPSLGVLSINALSAARKVLVPLQAEFFALQGMAKLTEIISLVQHRINPGLELTGIVACKVDRRTRLTQEVLEEVHRYFGDKLLSTMIRPNVKLAEAPSYAQTVLTYASDSNGAIDYRRLAAEWLGDRVPIEEPVDSDPSGATAPEAEAAPASLAEVLPEAAPSEDRPAPGSAETMSTAEMLAKLADPALPDWSVDTRVRPRGASGRERAPASRATSVWNAPSLLGPLSASELPPHCGSLSSRSRARNRGEPEREPRSAARLERVASDTKAWSLSLS